MNCFFVYGYFLADGICFYIGKGSANRDRRRSVSARNAYFINIVRKEEREGRIVTSKRLHENLSQDKSLKIEHELIMSLKPKANIYPSIGGRLALGRFKEGKRKRERRLLRETRKERMPIRHNEKLLKKISERFIKASENFACQ